MNQKKKNVLFLTAWFPTAENKSAGAFILEHARSLSQVQGVNMLIYHTHVLRGSGLLRVSCSTHQNNDGIRIRTLRVEGLLWKFVYYFPNLLRYFVKKDLIQTKPFEDGVDVLHANVIHPSGVIAFQLKNLLNAKKFFISEHWSKAHKYVKHPLFGKQARSAYSNADAVFPVSAFLASSIASAVGHPLPFKIIPNVVSDCFQFQTSKDSTVLRFVCVSNWQHPKRPDLIFDSLSSVVQQLNAPVELVVVGRGPLIDTYKNKSFDHPVTFLDYLSKKELSDLFNSSSFLLVASDTETFSVITAEALCSGLPVLASNKGALPELIFDDCGLLVENDLSSWARGIVEIASKKWERLDISKRYQNRFTIEKITSEFNEVYNSTLSPTQGASNQK